MHNFLSSLFKDENPVNWAVVITSVILGYIAWIHKPDDTISIHYFVIFLIASILIIAKISFFAFKLHINNLQLSKEKEELTRISLPKIISFHETNNRKIIVSTKSPLFTVGLLVTIVYRHGDSGGYEESLCTGKVGHIQTDADIMQIYVNINDQYFQNEIEIKQIFNLNSAIKNLKIYLGQIQEG